ncbi:Transglutaminase-like superfamily protein [Paenisporosarcina quisquiliarum]|nr:Transglutaminase-like superfamily protein [Paenisporosarcina quisquiliarum]
MNHIFKLLIAIVLLLSITPMHIFAAAPSSMTITKSEEQTAYDNIVKSLLNAETNTTFNASKISYKDIGKIVNQALANNPSISYYNGLTASSNGTINFKYKADRKVILEKNKKVNMEVDRIIKENIRKGMSDLDKVKSIHDYLVLSVAYDYDNFLKNNVSDDSYEAYGALINKIAVCDGYTKSMALILNKVGVQTIQVTGIANGGNHSWNMVKIDGQYYHVDTTWDDPVPNKPGSVHYNYFLKNTKQLKVNHQWDETTYPVATSSKFNYFHNMNNMVEKDGMYYYSDSKDNLLYKMDKKTLKKTKVLGDKVPYFAIQGQWIYYSNYSNGGYLYKVKLNGKEKKQINSIHSEVMFIKDNILYYQNTKTKKNLKLVL